MTHSKENVDAESTANPDSRSVGRRSFIGAAGTIAATAAVAVAVENKLQTSARADEATALVNPSSTKSASTATSYTSLDRTFLRHTYNLRVDRARANYQLGLPLHPNNGDDARYENKIGTDTRGLPHNPRGEVDLAAYETLRHALETQDPADFEQVTLGGTRKLAGVLGTLAINTTGIASQQVTVPAAPALASAEKAAEAVESSNAAINATILKAFFDESFVIPNPVQPDPNDPTKLIPYVGAALTVGGELNKLATNIGLGRNWAGIHWRSDAAASLPQAEEIALGLLRDERHVFREPFAGFKLTRFDGTTVEI